MIKTALYTVFGGLILLASILALRYLSGSPSFDISMIKNSLPLSTQIWIFLGFVIAFAIKLPILPLHGWLADFHQQNHPSGVADLMGTLYKVGGYGLFRLAIPLLPAAALELRPYLMTICALTAVYAAIVAFAQRDYKRLLAYASLSHMGLVGLGLFSLDPIAMTGALYLLCFQSIYTGGLFLMGGALHKRIGTLDISKMSGLAVNAPVMAGFGLVLWLASIGLPGLAGFIGEFSLFLGTYQISPWITFFALITTIAAAAFALKAYQQIFWQQTKEKVFDLKISEYFVFTPLIIALIFFGIYTKPAFDLLRPSIKTIETRMVK